MIIEHQEVEFTVTALDGWASHLYEGLALDVLTSLIRNEGIETTDIQEAANLIPNTLMSTYKYFTQFCLSTKTNAGMFSKYHLPGLKNIPEAYQAWLKLCSEPGFFDAWLDAYNHENKEEEDQKKEVTGE